MSELNLDKFCYERKRSVFDHGEQRDDDVPLCATTSDSNKTLYESNLDSVHRGDAKPALEKRNEFQSEGDWSSQFAEIVGQFTSETRLQIVDAITSSASMEEAVSSICLGLSPTKSSDCGNRKKRKRHCFIETDDNTDDTEAKAAFKRLCDNDCELETFDDGNSGNRKDFSKSKDPIKSNNNVAVNMPSSKDQKQVITHEGEPDVITLSSDDGNDDDDDDDGGGDDYSYDGVREKHGEEEIKLDGECSAVLSIVDCTDIAAVDSEDESYNSEEMATILSFFNDCTVQELGAVPGLSAKKAEKIIKMRPFDSWEELVNKLDSAPSMSSQLIDNCQCLLEERKAVEELMSKCEKISNKIQNILTSRLTAINGDQNVNGKKGVAITAQPKSLNSSLQLKPYQLTSLNWLVLMHEQKVNGILADEMGLGKTVQAISFLAHLSESGEEGPHLIIVPASTLDNWCREIKNWCPSMDFLMYYGNQEERMLMRHELEDNIDVPDIVITTYAVATGNADDRRFLRKLKCNYMVLDEGHMLKNMQSQRYQGLMKLTSRRRLLLTGTPLQNNLLELMSLLSFVMPSMFGKSVQGIKMLFSYSRMNREPGSNYEKATVEQAKRIMKPFVLRRLKKDVLQQLPAKYDHMIKCELTDDQRQLYNDSFLKCSKQFKQSNSSSQYSNILMMLRKASNHPLLLRNLYKDGTLLEMAKKYCKDPSHRDSEPDLVFEDMTVMSDFELHSLCLEEKSLASHCLSNDEMMKSGKFSHLDSLLPELKEKNCRVLLFSQFTMVMDIIEVYLSDRRHRYLRLDGQTSVVERQSLIDKFNDDPGIFIFLLSTKAGGVGINLTSANVVILHDIDFNPYNDKQAEDRCHRVGQTREVTVYRLIAKDTIEEAILLCAQSKLRLEQDMAALESDNGTSRDALSKILQEAFKNCSDAE
ncbi:SWI/SNF-related matrix-associated actin-dependent regulator of chromatin subfamily A containing DEAD/H box 1-like [Montipora capricornis]|uniref:SWI/SNF-related matrix-associated actin-dependent regulator of chromatin subfamily A containing DEAD/H box 1-like n=1 Tax=Montipora capricornis TaxID=246305 RepID=UPI0035F17757